MRKHRLKAARPGLKQYYLQNGIDIVVENRYHLDMATDYSRLPGATQATGTPSQPTRVRPERINSRQLLGQRGELVIEHEGREYHLRLTQKRKLILTA